MRIKCETCHAVYRVDSKKISSKGKRVKCTNCGNVWLYLLSKETRSTEKCQSSSIPEEISKTPTRNKSVRQLHSRVNIMSMAIMVPLLFFFSSTFQSNIPYKFRKVYRFMEMYDTSNVALGTSQVQVIEPDKSTGEVSVKVHWTIENRSENDRFVPGTHFVFYDKNSRKLCSHKLDIDKYDLIHGHGKRKFEKIIQGIPNNATVIQIKTGTAFEVLFY